jgi:phosphate-selective porin OprO/OprP
MVLALLIVGVSMVLLVGSMPVLAEEKEASATEEILQILKDKGEISDAQYDALKEKAAAEQSDWNVRWKDGLRVEKKDGSIKTRWGGRIQLDWATISADDDFEAALNEAGESGTLDGTGVEFRRLRLFTSGTLYDKVGYKLQVDFAGNTVATKDAYIDYLKAPFVGKIRVGQFKEPFSLEEITSSKYITFMERALPVLAFAPSRNTGIAIGNKAFNDRLKWDLGYFYNTDDAGESFTDFANENLTARLAGAPWFRDESHLLHVGLGYTHQFRDENDENSTLRYRARPEAHMTSVRLVNTDRFNAGGADLINPELAVVFGPFSFQGEYFWVNTDAPDVDDPTFTGWYAYGSWFITGESRTYKGFKFDRVKPNNNFNIGEPGWGAFELALRYSSLDLTDGAVEGGEEQNITAGFNWYLNPSSRIMLNYVLADLQNRADVPDDDTNIIQARFMVDF